MLIYQFTIILVVGFSRVHADIIEEIYHSTDGISFNRLAMQLKGKVSRVKLLKELRVLLGKGIVRIERDVRHKQKKLFVLDPSIKNVIEEVRIHEERALRDPFNHLPSLLSTYAEKMKRLKEEGLRSYLRHRLLAHISYVLADLEGVGKDGKGGFDL
jgi:hypothetical protein